MEGVTRNVRTYDHFCLTARALERVGDRWSLLVIRDLLTGAKRFTDLMDRLGGITPKTLSQRLRELEDAGIVAADREPGRREVWYRLTPAGADLGPVLGALGRWGLQHAWRRPQAGEPLHAEHLLRSVTQAIDLAAGDHEPARWHRDHPSPDRPHLRRVRHRHRHHRRNRASPAIPATDQHHGHRRTARLNRSRRTGGHVRHTLRTACSVCKRPSGRTPVPIAPIRQGGGETPVAVCGRSLS